MSWLQPKLHLKVSQKQILTPGLVQMVSVLALNRLELREMINQEMVANPMLEELTEESPVAEQDYSDEDLPQGRNRKSAGDRSGPIPSTNSTSPRFSISISTAAAQEGRGEHEVIEKPSFDKFISSPQGLTRTPDMAVERDGLQRDGARDRRGHHRQSRRERLPDRLARGDRAGTATTRWKTSRKRWRWCRSSIRWALARAICASAC